MSKNQKLIDKIKKLIREEALSIPLYCRSSLAEVRVIDVESFSEKLVNQLEQKENSNA